MTKKVLLLITLLLPLSLTGCGQNGDSNEEALRGKVSKIMIYQEGNAYSVASDEPIFEKIVDTAEEALVEVNDIYKGIDETATYTKTGQTLMLELSEAKPLAIGDQSGDKIPVRHVVIPLSGKYYEEDQLIMAGNSAQFLNMYKTDKGPLHELQELAGQALSK
ncbi:hypothetical protein CBW65_18985 [Tumebacillus avium]|uniref:Lipoprotein n=1 Tax=Tumebacillus avium TaxID=1903704 RepID=A0A1Y0ITM8_9BACL|nr:hypothetical protein [Tumebacillus avium]ARU62825.1 hypothetical protein CBW65_18985 [Tumebacillus avium]